MVGGGGGALPLHVIGIGIACGVVYCLPVKPSVRCEGGKANNIAEYVPIAPGL